MANELLDSTSERLAWLRKKKKLTQKALGRAVGVGHVYISQLEGGTRNASRALLGALANGPAILRSADPTAANIWLRTHMRVWLKDKEVLIVEWL